MLLPLALTALAVLAPPQDPQPGMLRGRVLSAQTGAPVSYARVEVPDTPEPLATVADSAGRYVLRRVPAGLHRLRASRVGHAPLEIEVFVPPGQEVVLDLSLALRPVALPPVTARANAGSTISDTTSAAPPELAPATIHTIDATPGVAELGLGTTLRTPSTEPADPSDVLYVRGAPADLKLVLLDGAPVYSPFHLGGLIPAFEPDVLRSADLYVGGAPARYDGGLSYVLDLETRAGRRNDFRVSGAADLVSGRLRLEGPLGERAGFLIGGRAVHGAGAEWAVQGGFPYAYADGLGRVDVSIGEESALGLTGFWNHESVRLGTSRWPHAAAEWGNRSGSLRFNGPLAGGKVELTAAFGGYRARLPLDTTHQVPTDGTARRVRLNAELSRTNGSTNIRYGVSYDRIAIAYRTQPASPAPATLRADASAVGEVAGAYVDVGWQPARALTLRGGLRTDVFAPGAKVRFAPRISAALLLSERAVLRLAAGRYRQFVRSPGPLVLPTEDAAKPLVYTPPPLTLASASHVVLGLEQELADALRLGVEGFFKVFEDVPVVVTSTGRDDEPSGARTELSRAHASGVDLWLRRSRGRLTGWLGYSLSWIWTVDGGATASDLFSGRQMLSAGAAGPLGGHGRFSIRFAYGAGLPYSALAADDVMAPPPDGTFAPASVRAFSGVEMANQTAPQLPDAPDEPYLRLDAEISRPWTTRWGGRTITITPYLKVLNALNRRDALFYHAGAAADGEPQPLAELPFLPVFGVEWTF
ncbi:MAG TPA: TonB-dependent receptor [Longimicrobiales bacterium]